MTCETCDQLRTLYEREKSKNAKMAKVVEAARRVMHADDSMGKCPGFDPEAGYRWDEVMQSLIEALAALGER